MRTEWILTGHKHRTKSSAINLPPPPAQRLWIFCGRSCRKALRAGHRRLLRRLPRLMRIARGIPEPWAPGTPDPGSTAPVHGPPVARTARLPYLPRVNKRVNSPYRERVIVTPFRQSPLQNLVASL
jgi:hypothetical protein